MPGACIPRVIEGATEALNDWIGTQRRLCDLKDAKFPDFPYDRPHCRAIYQLRYFPAYFFENFKMFTALHNLDVESPRMVSIGCGCLVDAGAASDVFEDRLTYDGYDIVDWENKAIEPQGNIHFHHGDVFDQDSFSPDTNVLVFSRSIGDLTERLAELGPIIANSEFNSAQIFLCATYNLDGGAIDGLRARLVEVSNLFETYRVGESVLYHPAGQGIENCGFARGEENWARHPDSNVAYLTGLSRRCREHRAECLDPECKIGRRPILRVHHLAYEILQLNRR